MVVMAGHLWVNLADIGMKERGFLLDALVSPSELLCTSVEMVVEKFSFLEGQGPSPNNKGVLACLGLKTRGNSRRLVL